MIESDSTVAERLKAVREDAELTQGEFALVLQRRAESLFGAGLVEHKYSQSLVNRLENGKQPPSLQDVTVYADVDKKKRGRYWVAFGMQQEPETGFTAQQRKRKPNA